MDENSDMHYEIFVVFLSIIIKEYCMFSKTRIGF